MNPSRRLLLAPLLVLVLTGGGLAVMAALADDPPPPLPADPLAHQLELVLAVPFTLEQPYAHTWRAERPAVDAGFVLVLAAHPDLLYPHQGPGPILFAGDQTLERLNRGDESGHLVALLPAPRDEAGRPAVDLSAAPLFFGEPGLAEDVDAPAAAAALARARERSVAAPAAARVAAALQPPVHFVDDGDLRTWAADLIERYSPQEVDLVAGLRVPRLRR